MVSNGKFFITRCHTPTFLQMSKEPLNRITLFIRYRIKRTSRPLLVRLVSNHRCHSSPPQTVSIALRRTTFVPRHLLRTTTNTTFRRANRHLIHRQKNQRIITCLSRTHQRRQRMNVSVAHPYDLGRPTPFRLANSVVRRLALYFFFVNAPAADLCTLTILPSTENRDQSIVPSACKRINNFSRIKSQVPSNCQRE